jgi:hypothetical protein
LHARHALVALFDPRRRNSVSAWHDPALFVRRTYRANAARRSRLSKSLSIGLLAPRLAACADTSQAPAATCAQHASPQVPAARATASTTGRQRGEGKPYEIADSEVWNVPDQPDPVTAT